MFNKSIRLLATLCCLTAAHSATAGTVSESIKVTGIDSLNSSKQQQYNNTANYNSFSSFASKPPENGDDRWYRIYKGATTGSIPFSNKHTEYLVDGYLHVRGLGNSMSKVIQPGVTADIRRCYRSGGIGGKCRSETVGKIHISACTFTVNDNGAYGCDTRKSWNYTAPENYGFSCRCVTKTATGGTKYEIKSVVAK